MSLNIWSRDDIRNVILAANAASGDAAIRAMDYSATAPETQEHLATYRAGYEAALMTLATAFGIPLVSNGRLRSPGVVIPGARLAVSYRAERGLAHLLQAREEIEP
jgi:hypothetical protein